MNKGRFKDVDWNLAGYTGEIQTWDHVQIAVLMDIRDELKAANAKQERLLRVLECRNFIDVPRKLERIARHTVKIGKEVRTK